MLAKLSRGAQQTLHFPSRVVPSVRTKPRAAMQRRLKTTTTGSGGERTAASERSTRSVHSAGVTTGATEPQRENTGASAESSTAERNEAKFWDGVAEGYAAKPVSNEEAYQRKLQDLRGILRPTDVALDIGCGTGSLALEMAAHCAHVHAVDVSPAMIRIARRKAQEAGIENITFYAEPVETVAQFERQSFDVVTAFSILHLVPDARSTVATISALLKPDGTFVSTTPCMGEWWWVPFRPLLSFAAWLGKVPKITVLKVSGLLDGFYAAGFRNVTRKEVGNGSMVAYMIASKEQVDTDTNAQKTPKATN